MNKNLIKKIEQYRATPFQKAVWKAIVSIPKGETKTYSWVAKTVGKPLATRAVGNALGKNPFAPEVPCHRVIRKDGSLGGFAGGIKKKKRLLSEERGS